jgi:hypothetical protein
MLPGFADRSWSSESWTDVQGLLWRPAKKHCQPDAGSLSNTLFGLFRQDAPGTRLQSCSPCSPIMQPGTL